MLPAARPGHRAGEEELQEEGLRLSDAGAFLFRLQVRAVPGGQFSALGRLGRRSASTDLPPSLLKFVLSGCFSDLRETRFKEFGHITRN